MDVYQLNLAGLAALCAGLFFYAQQSSSTTATTSKNADQKTHKKNDKKSSSSYSSFAFLTVYALVMASDWLQGPYLYSLYHVEHGIPAQLVSALFTTGFVSAGLAGTVVGKLADSHGRKAACLVFCGVYAASCLLTAIPVAMPAGLAGRFMSSSHGGDTKVGALLPSLFLGRALGGLATSLLFSAFESWMVTDFMQQQQGTPKEEVDRGLSATFGAMSTLNSLVAIASGVGSEYLVSWAGTRKAPFLASAALLAGAGGLIAVGWRENYGQTSPPPGEKAAKSSPKQTTSVWTTLSSANVLALGLASTMFEGSMYLFVFFWSPALEAVSSSSPSSLPYGLIFASFMTAVLLASLSFPLLESRLLQHNHGLLLSFILAVAALCFFCFPAAAAAGEQPTFWLFCLFEATVGLYWPCVGALRGRLVEDGVRAQVYAVLRVPLNVFVVGALMWTGGGGEGGRGPKEVFATCARLLGAAGAVVGGMVVGGGM